MSKAGYWRSGWPERGRRIAAVPPAAALTGALLALAAVTEAMVWATDGGVSALSLVAVFLLALFTTVPLAFLGPAAAAVAVTAASVLSLVFFQALMVAGMCAQLIALYRLGLQEGPRAGAAGNGVQPAGKRPSRALLLAPALALPFAVIALVQPSPARPEERVLTVLLASLGPAAALAGIAVDVELHFTDDALRLRIRDNGPGPPPGLAGSAVQAAERRRPAATGCPACANGPPPQAASCAPEPHPAAASRSRPRCPPRPR